MKTITNKFGTEEIYTMDDIVIEHIYAKNKNNPCIYTACTACMSVWTDMLSYIEEQYVKGSIITFTGELNHDVTDAIILGCQVTDLAIYNDIKTAEAIHNERPDITIYIGGCLAQRFDIPLPEYIRRLDVTRCEYMPLSEETIAKVDYKKPFWNKNLRDTDDELTTGNLFRHMYPLKIGAGCHGKCEYCTIRDTRGPSYEADAYLQVKEFLDNEDVVVISDSPTVKQIKDWCHIAERYNKQISFRNVEPQIAMMCSDELHKLAELGLLRIFHSPIQSEDAMTLKCMGRDVENTFKYIQFAQELRKLGVIVATNIIIDYKPKGKEPFINPSADWMNEHFDYWSWNPYFDGEFNMEKAEERFKKYIL